MDLHSELSIRKRSVKSKDGTVKIGVLAQYLDTRPDVYTMIEQLAQNKHVVVYLNLVDYDKSQRGLSDKIEFRKIQAAPRRSISNHIWILLFKILGQIPKSESNYYLTEKTKFSNPRISPLKRKYNLFLLELSKWLPNVISYDMYLKRLKYVEGTFLDDISEVLVFTQVYNDLFIAQVLNEKIPISMYVYSWDHPCKMKCFSKSIQRYLVWNEGIKDDLIELQGISQDKIQIAGASQLVYIHDYFSKPRKSIRPYKYDYIYLICATGYPSLARQEVYYFAKIAQMVNHCFPDVKVVIRPYPFLSDETIYQTLDQFSNVVMDQNNIQDAMIDKFNKIEHALCLCHFGTTMGYEASYFDIPVCLLDLADTHENRALYDFTHQYQNDKYLNSDHYPNVIKTLEQLQQVIQQVLLSGKANYLAYNDHVTLTEPKSIASIASLITNSTIMQE